MIPWRTTASFFVASMVATPAWAGDIFRFVDDEGVVHITDRIGDVPEPYHSMYAAELRRREKQQPTQGVSVAPASPASSAPSAPSAPSASVSKSSSGPSIVDLELAKQKKWQNLVASWRRRLASATVELEKVDAQIEQAGASPLIPVRASITALEKHRREVLAKAEEARRMLLEEIPQRARKENVPPKWLL